MQRFFSLKSVFLAFRRVWMTKWTIDNHCFWSIPIVFMHSGTWKLCWNFQKSKVWNLQENTQNMFCVAWTECSVSSSYCWKFKIHTKKPETQSYSNLTIPVHRELVKNGWKWHKIQLFKAQNKLKNAFLEKLKKREISLYIQKGILIINN